jgi:hypothetical protein
MKMLKNKLSLVFDWYQRNTIDMFGPSKKYPAVLGVSAPRENNAALRTRGFELSLGWQDQINSNMKYHVRVNLADHQSVVTKYHNEKGLIHSFYPGKKVGQIWGYTTVGLFPSDKAAKNDPVDQSFLYPVWSGGDVKYKDLNRDGKINNGAKTLSSHGDLSIIGNSTPRYSYGIDLGFQWKGFSISMLWQGIGKRDLWLSGPLFWGLAKNGNPSRNDGVFVQTLDYWTPTNKDAYYPKPYMSQGQQAKNQQVQTGYLQNGAYLRLKTAQIGYTLPQSLVSKLNITKFQIYVTGENLFFISPIMSNFDPEATTKGDKNDSGALYPLSKKIGVGLDITI